MQFAKGCQSYLIIPSILFIAGWVFAFADPSGLCPITLTIAVLFTIILLGFIIFFRDPELTIGEGIVSPANGKVTHVETVDGNLVIRIFMNVWNIHVNRSPMKGTVLSVEHKDGGHIPAFDKDAETNERVITDLGTVIGTLRIVQIAGSVARRIVPYISHGQVLERGERIGIIRLGSRVDLHIPEGKAESTVSIGDIVQPGQTVATFSKYGGNDEFGGGKQEGGIEKRSEHLCEVRLSAWRSIRQGAGWQVEEDNEKDKESQEKGGMVERENGKGKEYKEERES